MNLTSLDADLVAMLRHHEHDAHEDTFRGPTIQCRGRLNECRLPQFPVGQSSSLVGAGLGLLR